MHLDFYEWYQWFYSSTFLAFSSLIYLDICEEIVLEHNDETINLESWNP